ncbi:DUF4349 domain-containing protein [Novosphingobium sp.]|uniref:DUF4349 domain-containing protein n=1 Tax=Novosphingobium sp. TaxID=1874826 RepID=UPI0025D7E268|nr:DUF4349 domain-containing protein [Novosphingobium sp.]
MKHRLAAAALASVPVVLVVMIAISSSQVQTPFAPHRTQNKSGLDEAVHRSVTTADIAMPDPRMMAAPISPPLSPPPPPRGAASAALNIPPANLAVSLPQIAYRYSYGFTLDPRSLADVQQSQADMCERLGPATCRIIAMVHSGDDDGRGTGSLDLAVAASRARSFGSELAQQVASAGGTQAASSISGEDVSKQIVDTEARLRARTILRDRLMEVLTSRRGTVTELVEAERGVAQVNEEIDQARSWLAEMKGRVDFSAIHIDYNPVAAAIRREEKSSFMGPIRSVVGALGGIFGMTFAALIGVLALLAPFAALGWAGRKLWLRWRPLAAEPAAA